MVTVSEETAVDYELTAKIATEAFALGDVHFSAERIKWLYERSFGRGTTVLAAIDDGRKIGQIALIGQSVIVAGEVCPAVQLVDLFILQAYRSAQLVRKLYMEVEQFCARRNIRYILALPNDKAVLPYLNNEFAAAQYRFPDLLRAIALSRSFSHVTETPLTPATQAATPRAMPNSTLISEKSDGVSK